MTTTTAEAPAPGFQKADPSESALRAFTKSGSGPRATFPLVLVAVSVATLAMHVDAVPRYSRDAFAAGIVCTIALAIAVGKIVTAVKVPAQRALLALFLPTAFGALIGMLVQGLVLNDVGTGWAMAVRDLGGLVDTTQPIPWIASGIVLGGVPALVVSLFLVVAGRALKKLTGHDSSEGFSVAFTGGAGLFAAFCLVVVDPFEAPPLIAVSVLSAISLVIAFLVDGSRVRFLRQVYAGQDGGFDIVPASWFANDPSLAPVVAKAGSASVLVKVDKKLGSYRAAASQPVALVADTEAETLRPLKRRRLAASALLVAMSFLGAVAYLSHLA
jgi:hypothetical protein